MLLLAPALAADPLLRPEDRTAVLQALAAADLTTADLAFEKDSVQWDGVRRDAWRLPGIEGLLHDPMSVPGDASTWSTLVSDAAGDPRKILDGLAPLHPGAPVSASPTCTPDRASTRAWRQLHPDLQARICGLLAYRAAWNPLPGWSAEERDTLATMLTPDGEDRWDAGEQQRRLRALLARFRDLHLPREGVSRILDELAGPLPAADAWPASRLTLTFADAVVEVGSPGPDTFSAPITLDPGGDDTYRDPAAVYAVHLDLGGDDLWTGGDGTLGGTIGGLSVLIDRAGDDTYRADAGDRPANAALGAGVLGIGVLIDGAGDDSYRSGATSEGGALGGIGLLLDATGSDTYDASGFAQGFAGVQATGILWDGGGDDMYRAGGRYPDMPTRLPDHTLSLSQGFSIGMRPDAGGGLGLLVDDAGNDAYVADLFAQGCSYWFSRGYLVDRQGNDRYGMYQYGQGSGIHLSVGGLFDLGGNDAYTGGNIVQGSSHDYAVGWLVDRVGDDLYMGNSTAQAGSLTNSVTFLVDAGGDDAYASRSKPARGEGRYDRNRGSIGVFVDVAGTDRYDGPPGDGGVSRPWAYGIAVDETARLPAPDPEVPLPPLRALREVPAGPPTRPQASPEAIAELARGDAISCQTPPTCEQARLELAKGGPAAFARWLPALERDLLTEQYTIDALFNAMRSPENDPELERILLAYLDGPTFPAERWAVRWLGALKVDPARAWPVLERLVREGDPLLREAVATAILSWATHPPVLDTLTHDPEPAIRAVAALALGASGAPVEQITPLLLDDSALVRFDAADALSRRPPDAVRPALLATWRAGTFPTPAARRLVLELLIRAGGKEVAPIVAAVAAKDADPWAQRKARLATEPRFPWEP